MSDIEKLIGRIYQGFFLRDILGFVVPGSFSIISLLVVIYIRIPFSPLQLPNVLCANFSWSTIANCELIALNVLILTFLGFAYLWAWVLLCLSYVLFLNQNKFSQKIFPQKDLLDLSQKNLDELTKLTNVMPTVTRGALQTDFIRARSMSRSQLEKLVEEIPYTERASSLMLLSSNLGSATFVLIIALVALWLLEGLQSFTLIVWTWRLIITLILLVIGICLYKEHWRIWNYRNLQLAVYGAALRESNQSQQRIEITRTSQAEEEQQ